MSNKVAKKYFPEDKWELKDLCDNDEIKLDEIDTSKVMDMSGIFYESKRKDFSGIEIWDTSNVKNMSCMFYKALFFNQDISKWDTSNVEDMYGMFYSAVEFNQPIGQWNVSNVKNMGCMFCNAYSFNQSIEEWTTFFLTKSYGLFKNYT